MWQGKCWDEYVFHRHVEILKCWTNPWFAWCSRNCCRKSVELSELFPLKPLSKSDTISLLQFFRQYARIKMWRLVNAHLHSNADCQLLVLSMSGWHHVCTLRSPIPTHQRTPAARDLVPQKKVGYFFVLPSCFWNTFTCCCCFCYCCFKLFIVFFLKT